MNIFSTRMNGILLSALIACNAIGAQNNSQDVEGVVWYKKRSTHVAAAAVVTLVGLYALAVCKNKIASPLALLALLTGVDKATTKAKTPEVVAPAPTVNNEVRQVVMQQKETQIKEDVVVDTDNDNDNEDGDDQPNEGQGDQPTPPVESQQDDLIKEIQDQGSSEQTTVLKDDALIDKVVGFFEKKIKAFQVKDDLFDNPYN